MQVYEVRDEFPIVIPVHLKAALTNEPLSEVLTVTVVPTAIAAVWDLRQPAPH